MYAGLLGGEGPGEVLGHVFTAGTKFYFWAKLVNLG